MKIRIKKLEYILTFFLFFIVPLHYYICEIFINFTSIDNIVRDIVICLLFFLLLKSTKGKIEKNILLIIVNCLILMFFAIISFIDTQPPGIFNILRTYLVPTLMYFVCSKITLSSDEFDCLNKFIIIQMTIIAIYGAFQAYILGDDFLVNLGYPSYGGHLSGSSYYISGFFGYQRSVGTFVSPNVCGVIIAIVLCILLFSKRDYGLKKKTFFGFLLLIGLLTTFSRSAMLGLAIAVLFQYFIIKKSKIRISSKRALYFFIIVFIGVVVSYLMDVYILDGLFSRMITRSIGSAFDGTDPSAMKHLEDLFVPLNTIFQHPFGLGFGNNGPMAGSYIENSNGVESSLYLMMYETGIVGGVLFFSPYFLTIIKTIRNKRYRYYVPATICVTVLVTYFLLPNVQTYEVLFYSFAYMGFYNNRSVQEIYQIGRN